MTRCNGRRLPRDARPITRRDALRALGATALGAAQQLLGGAPAAGADRPDLRLSAFTADVTPPIGHACMGGGIAPAARIDDPLFVHGLLILGAGEPVVLAAVDWCEIRNDAHDAWREALASAAGTSSSHVLVTSIHQHDAPVADLEAQRILERRKAAGSICDIEFHARAVEQTARALREAARSPRRVSHAGMGKAKVARVASNRRFLGPDGKAQFGRTSATRDANARDAPEGTIDPWLRTLSFWDGDRPIAAISAYATHPMSYYGKGGVSADFVGMARRKRKEDDPSVAQIYLSGASGNVTAGKHNDGSPGNRPVLAERMYDAMLAAWKATERHPIEKLELRSVPLRLEPRTGSGFTVEDLERRLETDPAPFGQCLAALGLSWRKRADAGRGLDVPVLDLGPAQLVVLPGESYVEYQLRAQEIAEAARPGSFVLAAGYGECATGYVPTEKAFEEGDTNLNDWCWVAPGAERSMTAALEAALGKRKP